MARPIKDGVEYFPFDVCMDEKIDLIEAEFGLTGFAVIVKLYQWVYTRGYYCEWTEEVALLFSRTRCGLGGSVVSEIVNAAIKRGIFDKSMFDKYGILTSTGIQKRYFEAVSRRKCVNIKKQYLLVNAADFLKNVNINWINDDINPKNADNNSQSKVKESKVKESKKDIDMFSQYANGNERLLKALEDFEEMRKLIKKPMTEKAKSMLLKSLDGISNDTQEKIAVLDQSTLHNWQTVYPLKKEKTGVSGQSDQAPSYDIDAWENFSIFDDQEDSQ